MEKVAQAGQYLSFTIGTETYGIPIAAVREINAVTHITEVPQMPSFIEGVMNLRGKVIPVANLRVRLGFPRKDYTKQTCIIIIDGQDGMIGMIVDSVCEVIGLTSSEIEPTPTVNEGDGQRFIMGLGKAKDKILILLDVILALSKQEKFVQDLASAAGSEKVSA